MNTANITRIIAIIMLLLVLYNVCKECSKR